MKTQAHEHYLGSQTLGSCWPQFLMLWCYGWDHDQIAHRWQSFYEYLIKFTVRVFFSDTFFILQKNDNQIQYKYTVYYVKYSCKHSKTAPWENYWVSLCLTIIKSCPYWRQMKLHWETLHAFGNWTKLDSRIWKKTRTSVHKLWMN